MLQAVMVKPGKIEFSQVKKPKPGDHEVLIKVRRIGICGSDIHVFHGLHPYTSYPVVQGHEVSGEIKENGILAKGFSVGDSVTFMPLELSLQFLRRFPLLAWHNNCGCGSFWQETSCRFRLGAGSRTYSGW